MCNGWLLSAIGIHPDLVLKSFAHRATLELRGTQEASVASRQPFTWLNTVYLRVFRSHLQA